MIEFKRKNEKNSCHESKFSFYHTPFAPFFFYSLSLSVIYLEQTTINFTFCGFDRHQLPRGRIFFSTNFTFHTNHTNYRMEQALLWFQNLLIWLKHHDEQLEPIVGVERNDFYKKFTEIPLNLSKRSEEPKKDELLYTYGSSNCGATQHFEKRKISKN